MRCFHQHLNNIFKPANLTKVQKTVDQLSVSLFLSLAHKHGSTTKLNIALCCRDRDEAPHRAEQGKKLGNLYFLLTAPTTTIHCESMSLLISLIDDPYFVSASIANGALTSHQMRTDLTSNTPQTHTHKPVIIFKKSTPSIQTLTIWPLCGWWKLTYKPGGCQLYIRDDTYSCLIFNWRWFACVGAS